MYTSVCFVFFFFNDTATTEIYTLSLHDALPIWDGEGSRLPVLARRLHRRVHLLDVLGDRWRCAGTSDRKSTRLNSSHLVISYAVFCLKKKNEAPQQCIASPHLDSHAVPRHTTHV